MSSPTTTADYAARLQSARSGLLRIVCNPGSGSQDDVGQRVLELLVQAGRDCQLMPIDSPESLGIVAHEAALGAARDGGAVIAAGGDGTISTVAQFVHGTGCVLGVVPAGTFNFFGREHGISQQIEESVQTLLHGAPQPVQVGLVNERLMLVNASVGLYPQILQDREAWKQRLGRNRVVAFAAGIWTLLRGSRPMTLELDTDQGEHLVWRTPTLFVGNNRLQFEQAGVDAPGVARGRLEAVALKPIGTWRMLGLLLRGALGSIGDSDDVLNRHVRSLQVKSWRERSERRKRSVRVAIDGEIHWLSAPLNIRVADTPLWLIKPTIPAEDSQSLRSAQARTQTNDVPVDAAVPIAAPV